MVRLSWIPLIGAAACFGQDSPATARLKARGAEFREEVVKVADGVYTAVGDTASTSSMIVGTNGVIIIDTGMAPPHAQRILAEFRKIADQPVRAIIFTHGHGDHTGGAAVFAAGATPEIWAHANYGSEDRGLGGLGLNTGLRGTRQAGFALPPEKRINNGIAPALFPGGRPGAGGPGGGRPGGFAFAAAGPVRPNKTFSGATFVRPNSVRESAF